MEAPIQKVWGKPDKSFLPALQLSHFKYWNKELLLSNTNMVCSEVIVNISCPDAMLGKVSI